MSRDLVTFNRTERDRRNKDDVERLCTDMGCSEPVARNFLKYKKFGIGPLADFGSSRQRSRREGTEEVRLPVRIDLEQRLREQKEKEEREEQEMLEEMKKKRTAKRAGLKPLGPVMAREEAVDPLQKVAAPEAPPEAEEVQAEEESGPWKSVPRSDWKREEEEKKRKIQEQKEQAHHKHKKKKKRRREDDEKSEDSPAKRRLKSRSPSPPVEELRKSSSTAGLMTEKEVLAMMGKEKAKEKPQRGSVQARMRIQREMQEWNSTKAENEEFWKAPRFALCYSAETSRSLRGNTDSHRKEHK